MSDTQARLDAIRQMCSAPSSAYSAGEWCEAANVLLLHLEAWEASPDTLAHRATWIPPGIHADLAAESHDEFDRLHRVEHLQVVQGEIWLGADFVGFRHGRQDIKDLVVGHVHKLRFLPWKKSSNVSL